MAGFRAPRSSSDGYEIGSHRSARSAIWTPRTAIEFAPETLASPLSKRKPTTDPRVSSAAPSFTCFFPFPASSLRSDGAVQRTDYAVESVAAVRGCTAAGIEPGQTWSRVEQPGSLAVPDAPFLGSTQHLVYTDAAARSELSQISSGPSGPIAVLIPLRKSAAWWALAHDERQAYFTRGPRAGHTALGRPFADRIYRRLYHARYLPGSTWDFLTYFEFPEAHRGVFLELLSILRDPEQNPEWSFVDRELELWMHRRT
jgi:hypothetical protein